MEATVLITLIDTGITLIEKLMPSLKAAFAKGEISAADQQALVDRLNKLRTSDAFSGKEWDITP